MNVLALDPGYERVGIAVIASGTPKEQVLYSACLRTSSKDLFPDRLREIGLEVERLLSFYHPDKVALEQLFFNTNQKTAMRVAQVCGVILYIARKQGVETREYTPLQVKMAMLGYGRGEKRQVIDMVHRLVDLPKKDRLDDEYDAIAVGLTCLATEKNSRIVDKKAKLQP